jgi:chromate transporter
METVAVSQVLPGPGVGNLTVMLGQRLRGFPGAVIALIAMLTPGAVLMVVLSALYFQHGQLPTFISIFRGIAAAAAGLALATGVQMGWHGARSVRGLVLAGGSIACMIVLRLPTVAAIVLFGAIGIALHWPERGNVQPPPQPHPTAVEQGIDTADA